MLKLILLAGLAAWAIYLLSSLERRSLYFPDKVLLADPRAFGLPFEDLRLKTADGESIHAWLISQPKNPATAWTVLLCHGNAGNISHRLEKAGILYQLGYDVLLFDYRGYGLSTGKPSEKGTYADAEEVYRNLVQEKSIHADRIVFYGESLGGAVALEMALRHPQGRVILEGAFTSTVAMGKLVFPWLPVKWIVRYAYDNLSKIGSLKIPLLQMHAAQDEIVPFAMGQILFNAAPKPKSFVTLSGGHNDGYAVSGEVYRGAVKTFLN